VHVSVIAYEPVEFAGVTVARFSRDNPLLASFPGEWLISVVDGREQLIAFLTRGGDELLQAIWSASPFLSWSLQCFMSSEFTHLGTLNDPDLPPEAREVMRRYSRHLSFDVPGYREIVRRLRRSASGESKPDD